MSETPPDDATDVSTSDQRDHASDDQHVQAMDDPLSPAFRAAASDLLDADPETLDAFFATAAEAAGATEHFTVDQLCHAEDGEHVAHTDEETYRFLCFFDGVVLAGLTDTAVTVETVDETTGDLITIEATGGESVTATASTDDAVVSFGIAPDPAVDGSPAPADLYGLLCPYVKAFESPATYAAWAEGVDAPTVAVSFDEAVALVRPLTS